MLKKKKGFNERKYIEDYNEFKKKKQISSFINNVHRKCKQLKKDYESLYELREERFRHIYSTNKHLQKYIADLSVRLYSAPKGDDSFKIHEKKNLDLYNEINSILDKYQRIKGEKLLNDKKALEDKVIEQADEEQFKEFESLSKQENYEKYTYDKLLKAQDRLIDICQLYRTRVHICEKNQQLAFKLKMEYLLSKDMNRRLTVVYNHQKKVEENYRKKLKSILSEEEYNKLSLNNFESSFNSDETNQKNDFEVEKKNMFRCISGNIRKRNSFNENKNNFIKKEKQSLYRTIYQQNNKMGKNNSMQNINVKNNNQINSNNSSKRNKFHKIDSSKILHKNNSDLMSTNFTPKNNYLEQYDRRFLDVCAKFLTDLINKKRSDIKQKTIYKSNEIRTNFQLKYVLGKCIEDLEIDIENERKKNFYIDNFYEQIVAVNSQKRRRKYSEDIKEINVDNNDKIENLENKLMVLTYIYDNVFSGLNKGKSIFPKKNDK